MTLGRLVVYYPYVASVVGEKRGGSTYYYLVESARVGGKPRIVSPWCFFIRGLERAAVWLAPIRAAER